ncbi:MAG: hypothetical protein ACREDF_07435 [Thermoplasmata archaeon]
MAPSGDTTAGYWADLHDNRSMEFYPRVHLIPSGEILRRGPERKTLSFQPRLRE